MRTLVTVLAAGSLLLGAETSVAQQIDNIGNQSQVVFGVDRVMGIVSETWKLEDQNQDIDPDTGDAYTYTETSTITQTHVALFGSKHFLASGAAFLIPRLALDFFPAQGFSLGGSLMFISSSGESETETDDPNAVEPFSREDGPSYQTLLLHPRMGYAFQVDETIAIWPRVGITWVRLGLETEDGDEMSLSALELTLEAMLGLSPIEHFAFLIGPFAEIGLSGTARTEPTGDPPEENDSSISGFGLAVSVVGYYP